MGVCVFKLFEGGAQQKDVKKGGGFDVRKSRVYEPSG